MWREEEEKGKEEKKICHGCFRGKDIILISGESFLMNKQSSFFLRKRHVECGIFP